MAGYGRQFYLLILFVLMIVTYEIGILAAELRLTAISSVNGKVIHNGIEWKIQRVTESGPENKESVSEQAQPLFSVTEGDYTISVKFKNEIIDLGGAHLQQNTRTDAVFILNNDQFAMDDDYFSDYDPAIDFHRRTQERDEQSIYGQATLPLRDPSLEMPQGELGSQVMAHPLLQDSAQFDGVPPDMRPDPSENEAALQLTLAQRLEAAPGMSNAPTPTR